jgi:hypothetical protein
MIYKHKIDSYYIINRQNYDGERVKYLIDHADYKSLIQDYSNFVPMDSLPIEQGLYNDNINKVDWQFAKDFNRPWVQEFMKFLEPSLFNIANELGFTNFRIHEIWFQQYEHNGAHGWHTHSSNFTGVFYLDLPAGSPKTQLVEPFSNKIINPDIQQNDIIIFPSFTVHRAPTNLGDKPKTIISFNFDFEGLSDKSIKEYTKRSVSET